MVKCNPWLLAIAALPALGGCAAHRQLASASVPARAEPLAPMPQPPPGSYVGMTIPAALADGSYATPNRGLDVAAQIWHVRVALNVAALSCRGSEGLAITAGYNALLTREKAALARADKAVIAAAGGQAPYDAAMTRLYNYFAQPGAKTGFCAAAAAVTNQIATSTRLGESSAQALAQLDAPFTDFYRAYGSYQIRLADWQTDRLRRASLPLVQRPQVALASSAPASMGSSPQLEVDPAIFEVP